MKRSVSARVARTFQRWLNDESPRRSLALTRHLALRGDPDAATELERVAFEPRPGAIALSPAAMVRHAATRDRWPTAAMNIAMQRFNLRDLQGYRYWLRRAARNGDPEAKTQLARFETRLPHGVRTISGEVVPTGRITSRYRPLSTTSGHVSG
ncbi:hypothetical protein [Sphingomonas rubra]|uniref:hypothetical protein n=1 Tax=Sphingomonas rubra TaxID=634430 RepID=UPI00116065CA|nr:hypothetical protein [Sphingomonas rubra]